MWVSMYKANYWAEFLILQILGLGMGVQWYSTSDIGIDFKKSYDSIKNKVWKNTLIEFGMPWNYKQAYLNVFLWNLQQSEYQ
jgi:hypothetical protein